MSSNKHVDKAIVAKAQENYQTLSELQAQEHAARMTLLLDYMHTGTVKLGTVELTALLEWLKAQHADYTRSGDFRQTALIERDIQKATDKLAWELEPKYKPDPNQIMYRTVVQLVAVNLETGQELVVEDTVTNESASIDLMIDEYSLIACPITEERRVEIWGELAETDWMSADDLSMTDEEM